MRTSRTRPNTAPRRRGGGRALHGKRSRVVAGRSHANSLPPGVEVGAYVERVQDISMPLPRPSQPRRGGRPPRAVPASETAAHGGPVADVKKPATRSGAPLCSWPGRARRLGRTVFDRLHADLAKACGPSRHQVLELGSGLSGTLMRGSEHNDKFVDRGDRIGTATNRSGGIKAASATGRHRASHRIQARGTVLQPGSSVDRDGNPVELEGRDARPVCPARAVPRGSHGLSCLGRPRASQRAARLTFGA